MDEARLIRRRLEALALPSPPDFAQASPAFVGRVYDGGSMPASLPGQFLVHPVRPGGTESEGAAASNAVDTSVGRVVMVVGNQVPAVGDDLLCRLVGGRWVAERHGAGGGGGIVIPGCPCLTTPATVNLTWVSGGYHGYTHDPSTGAPFNATIQYGPPPGPNIQGTYGNGWYSTAAFPDGTGDSFYYWFRCSVPPGGYVINRLYETSRLVGGGGPYLDVAMCYWVMGAFGNVCNPLNATSVTRNTALFSSLAATITG